MKKAIMYGAGNIGRGFIGKVLCEAGYHVVFIDIAENVVSRLNKDHAYPVRIVSNEASYEVLVKNVSAVNGLDTTAVAQEILEADIMATAVGVNILPRIVSNIAAGLNLRAQQNKAPLDIIICENLLDADKYLRCLLEKEVDTHTLPYLAQNVGLVEASIGRMVPVMTDDMRGDNCLRVWVEPYEELPVDKDAFRSDIPPIKTLIPFSPFGFYIRRKLFIHNMGHALCAYFGWLKGYSLISEAAADRQIAEIARTAMLDVAAALHKDYGIALNDLEEHIDDLLHRFCNRELGDSIPRVGKDPVRKLKSNDRLTGAVLYCRNLGVDPSHILPGIAAALCFDNSGDEAAMQVQSAIRQDGIESAVKRFCGLEGDLLAHVVIAYKELQAAR